MPEDPTTLPLLRIALSAAVPLWIGKLKTRQWSELMERRDKCVEMIASHGDNILYRSKKPGQTAEAFNALAEAIAILSFAPGGVRVFGLEFWASHPEGRHNAEQEATQEGY